VPTGSPTTSADAGPLAKLEGLVAKARVQVHLIEEDLKTTMGKVEECEKYLCLGGSVAEGQAEHSRLFGFVDEFLKEFSRAWHEVHRDDKWTAVVLGSPVGRSPSGEVLATARGPRRDSTSTPRRRFLTSAAARDSSVNP